jgi:hypothetical protein
MEILLRRRSTQKIVLDSPTLVVTPELVARKQLKQLTKAQEQKTIKLNK